MVAKGPADEKCSCGFYVLSSMDAAATWAQGMADNIIVGAVMGWGRVVQHGEDNFLGCCAGPPHRLVKSNCRRRYVIRKVGV